MCSRSKPARLMAADEDHTIRDGSTIAPLGDTGKARDRLNSAGLTVMTLGSDVQVAAVRFGSTAEKLGLEQGFRITSIEVPSDRPDKEWLFIPALVLLALIVFLQRLRREPPAAARPAQA